MRSSSASRQNTGSSSRSAARRVRSRQYFITGAAAARRTDRGPHLIRQYELPGQLAALPHGICELHAHGCQQDACCAAVILQHGAEQMFRLGPVQVRVLRPDDGVIHGALEVRRKSVAIQMQSRCAAGLSQLTAHFRFPDLLALQKPCCRPVILLQDRQQQVAGIGFFSQPRFPASSTALRSS